MPEPIAHAIDELMRLGAARHGDRPMAIDPTGRVSYRELDSTTID